MQNPAYTDNNVPIGSREESIKRGVGAGELIGAYVFENINLDRPGKVIERMDEISQDNGWVLVGKQANTGSGTLQIATAETEVPQIGDWFEDNFNPGVEGNERWIITKVGQPFAQDAYYKANVDFRLSRNPPSA